MSSRMNQSAGFLLTAFSSAALTVWLHPAPQTTDVRQRVLDLEALLTHISNVDGDLVFDGVNVTLQRGGAQGSGLGNILIGPSPGTGTGTHNIVLGSDNTFDGADGIVGGTNNQALEISTTILSSETCITASYESVIATGGLVQMPGGSGVFALTSSGAILTGDHSTVVGGSGNQAEGEFSVVSGSMNKAEGLGATVLGSFDSEANGDWSTVVGGASSRAQGESSAVIGGAGNVNRGAYSTIAGGFQNELLEGARHGVVVGGRRNGYPTTTPSPMHCVAVGGTENVIDGNRSVIVGGMANRVTGATTTVTGGRSNEASGMGSTVSGGLQRSTSATNSWRAGGLFQNN